METSIEDNEIGKEYLKANLKGELGFGLGTQWFYKNWNLDVGINLVRYQIKDKSSKELVEAIASQNIGLRETLDDLTGNSAVFSDLYSNYLISPRPNALQLLVKGGYEFPVNKQKSLKLGVDIGVATTMHSFVHIDSQRTSRLAEILLATVTPTLSDRLENLVNWKMIPFAGIGLVYQIPARNVRSY
ncbi:hypothetical protein J2X69_004826 [Algoriphagus sp. 4150]|uniref:hypothetical protein n=1 Tax=Algoriphagus sp. 4150 TaxID=2817756 RepID=UPI00286405F2|nr:hypothetical protein [Algoriphagus sp. 4150]MDR7132455.1 hypothetical protein [Algoriphagus sp. 4150]